MCACERERECVCVCERECVSVCVVCVCVRACVEWLTMASRLAFKTLF